MKKGISENNKTVQVPESILFAEADGKAAILVTLSGGQPPVLIAFDERAKLVAFASNLFAMADAVWGKAAITRDLFDEEE